MRNLFGKILFVLLLMSASLFATKSENTNQNFINLSLQDSIHWLEMEKNTDYTICIEDVNEAYGKEMISHIKKSKIVFF